MGATCCKLDGNVPSFSHTFDSPSPHIDVLRDLTKITIQENLYADLRECCQGNTYYIRDEKDQLVLYAVEIPQCNACCSRWFCGPSRGFRMNIYDMKRNLILQLNRKSCRLDCCCCVDCCCCNHSIAIQDARGKKLGDTTQMFSCCSTLFHVKDVHSQIISRIEGACCPCRCCCDQEMALLTSDIFENEYNKGKKMPNNDIFSQTGSIRKKWEESSLRGVNMDHENFQLNFPPHVTCEEKAILLGAFFLVEFMYFEMS